jgi:hypothetical protein
MQVNNNDPTAPIRPITGTPSSESLTISDPSKEMPSEKTVMDQMEKTKGSRAIEILKAIGRGIVGVTGLVLLVAAAPLERVIFLLAAGMFSPLAFWPGTNKNVALMAGAPNSLDEAYMQSFSRIAAWMIGDKGKTDPAMKIEEVKEKRGQQPIKSTFKAEKTEVDEEEPIVDAERTPESSDSEASSSEKPLVQKKDGKSKTNQVKNKPKKKSKELPPDEVKDIDLEKK